MPEHTHTTAIVMRAGGLVFLRGLPLLTGVVVLGPAAPCRCCSVWVVTPTPSPSSLAVAPAWRGGCAARRDDHRVLLASTALRVDDPMPPPRPRPLAATSTWSTRDRGATTLRTMPPLSLSISSSSLSSSDVCSIFFVFMSVGDVLRH